MDAGDWIVDRNVSGDCARVWPDASVRHRIVTRHSTLLLLALVLPWTHPAPVAAQEFTNVDSIEVRGLVFIGKLDKFQYAYSESIRAELVVANRTQEPITLALPQQNCTAILPRETWCLAAGDSCTPLIPVLQFCTGCPGCPPAPRTFDPGEAVLQRATLGSDYPGTGWEFRSAAVRFADPWGAAPYWTFAVWYERVPVATFAARSSWSAVKALWR